MKTLPENGWLARLFLSMLATAGLFYVNIMAAIVDGLITGLHFSPKDAGFVASANVYGAACGALLAVFVVKHINWKVAAGVLLGLLIAIDVASMLLHDPQTLIAARFAHGTVGGLLVGISYGVIARMHLPEKTFGVLLFVQFGLGGLGLMYLPRLVPLYGYGVLFLSLAAFSAVALAMLPFLGRYPRPEPVSGAALKANVKAVPLILTFLGLFAFQAGNMGLAAYIIGLGKDEGLTIGPITDALGWANWIGALGSLPVLFIGVKFGRLPPLMAGLILTIIGCYAFHYSTLAGVYFAANVFTAATWTFVIPYYLGMCAAYDPAGRMAALGGFFSKMGLASGPLGAALIVDAKLGYGILINATVAVLVIGLLLSILPAAAIDRQGRSPS